MGTDIDIARFATGGAPAAGGPPLLSIEDESLPLRVESASSAFAMSCGFTIRVIAEHPEPRLGPAAFLGRRIRVEFPGELGKPSARGVIRSFRHLGSEPEGGSRYELDIASPLCLLALRTDSRIFQGLRASDIAHRLIVRYGEDAPGLQVLGESVLPTYEYRTQYDETDYDALFRLLAADGVASFFDLYADGALTLVQDTRRLGRHARARVAFAAAGSVDAPAHHVREVEVEGTIASLAVNIQAESAGTRQAPIIGRARIGLESVYERLRFEHGSAAVEELGARATAALWADYSASLTITLRGTAFVPPGAALRLLNAPHAEASEDLLVVEARSAWSAAKDGQAARSTSHHELVCIPLAHRFVPREFPKKRMPGLQRATLVGDGDIDSLGRVLCRFGWDRDGSGTRRVPVPRAWLAKPGSRGVVGDDVLVGYLGGDFEAPVIVGVDPGFDEVSGTSGGA